MVVRKREFNPFLEDEAELGSDNEEHDDVVRRVLDDEEEGEEELDRDLPGLIDNEVQENEEDEMKRDELFYQKQQEDDKMKDEEILKLVLGEKR